MVYFSIINQFEMREFYKSCCCERQVVCHQTVKMAAARPSRRAADRARELFASGFRARDDDFEYLTEDEEDNIDEHLVQALRERQEVEQHEESDDDSDGDVNIDNDNQPEEQSTASTSRIPPPARLYRF